MDFDADGKLDLVSGSYDPGRLYLFRGLGRGEFAASEIIKDRLDRPIVKVPDQKDPVESFGSWMATVDWDDDGYLDLLVGTFDGLIFLRRNEGTRAQPAYATANEWVKVGPRPLRVPGGEHACPVVADWDGDGRWDIVTGAGVGGVYWYRNVGERARPAFEAPVALVPKHEGIGYSEILEAGQEPKPGIRSQVAVVDPDGDGKLDLLVGDFATNLHIRPDLTPDQHRAFAEAARAQDESTKSLRASQERVRAEFKAESARKGISPSDWNTPENSARFQAMYQAMQEEPAYKRHQATYEAAEAEVAKYVDVGVPGKHLGKDPAVAHGYVWHYRRK